MQLKSIKGKKKNLSVIWVKKRIYWQRFLKGKKAKVNTVRKQLLLCNKMAVFLLLSRILLRNRNVCKEHLNNGKLLLSNLNILKLIFFKQMLLFKRSTKCKGTLQCLLYQEASHLIAFLQQTGHDEMGFFLFFF